MDSPQAQCQQLSLFPTFCGENVMSQVSVEDIHSLGLRIKMVREILGETQSDFATKVGVSRSFLSEMESGRSKPSIQLLMGVCKHFPDVDRDWLMTGRGQISQHISGGSDKKNLADNMNINICSSLNGVDADALICAVNCFGIVSNGSKITLDKSSKKDWIKEFYLRYCGAYQDALSSEKSTHDPRGYAETNCESYARKIAASAQ